MKKVITIFLVLILSCVSATTINAPEEIPSNINWSYSIELNPSNSFTKTEIYFDELLIVTAFNDKQPIIQEDFVLKAFVFDKKPEDNTGLTLYISYFGINEGQHKIKTKTFNQGNLIEENEFELKAVDTITAMNELPESFSQEMDLLMKDIIKKINEDRTKLEELKNSTEQNLKEKADSMEQEINSLEETLNELNALKEKAEETQGTENVLEDTNKTIDSGSKQELKENTLITGFYSFSTEHAWKGVVFLFVLIILLGLFQAYKKRTGKTGDTIFVEEALEEHGKESLRDFANEEAEEVYEEKKSKRFGLGDLIQKKD